MSLFIKQECVLILVFYLLEFRYTACNRYFQGAKLLQILFN